MINNVVCSCGKQAEKKSFTTFEYFYCPNCKTEVGGKAPPSLKLVKNHVKDLDDGIDRMWAAAAAAVNNISHQLYGAKQPAKPGQQPPLPPGTVAAKGEKITCPTCGAEHGEVIKDLRDRGAGLAIRSASWTRTNFFLGNCCSFDSAVDSSVVPAFFHVRGRGYV